MKDEVMKVDKYEVKVLETVEKIVTIKAKDAAEAQFQATEMDDDEFESVKIIGSQSTAKLLCTCIEKDFYDDDLCEGIDDCDECLDYCEVCGSCAKKANFAPNRGKCAHCKFRCSACNACNIDE